jgi:sugar (pentulose or hexulose) kinase
MYALGMDFGTQSVKIAILDLFEKEVIYTGAFEYDSILSFNENPVKVLLLVILAELLSVFHLNDFIK